MKQFIYQSITGAAVVAALFLTTPQHAEAQALIPAYAHGVLISAASWGDTPAYGVYSFPVSGSDPSLTAIKTGEDYGATFGAVYGGGHLLATKPGLIIGGSPIEMDYNIFDGVTYELTGSRYGDAYRTLLASTYDTATGKTFVFLKDRYSNTYSFGTMDTSSGYFTEITNKRVDTYTGWNALGSTPQGRLYAIDYNGNLLSVNKKTGETTHVASTGLTSAYATSGEIDPATGRFIFVTVNENSSSLYSIDLTTANAEKIYDFADKEQFFALHFTTPQPTDTKPSPVRSFAADFTDASLSGTIKFNAPVTDDDWGMGSGPLTYYVYIDGIEVATGETAYGASGIEVPVSVATPGMYEFSAKVVTPGGAHSDLISKELWVGQDIPGNVSDFKAAYDGYSFTLSWAAPTGANGGYFDPSGVTYTITMLPQGTVVAENISGTSFSFDYTKPAELTTVTFSIMPSYGTASFSPVESNPLVIGNAPEPPFSENFDSGEAKGFTVIDNNLDGVCFRIADGVATLEFGREGYTPIASDDWLVLPPLRLKGGHAYYVGFHAYGQYSMYTERVAAYAATEPSADALAGGTQIVAPVSLNCDKTNPAELGSYFIPESDGEYYIGIYGCSIPDQYALIVDNITVSAGVTATAPAAVTDLTAIPGKNGAIAMTLRYTAPSLNFVGGQLDALTKVEIYRDGTLAGTQTPAMNETMEWTDPEPTEGDHTYTLVPYNGSDTGDPAKITTHIGINRPLPTASVNVTYGSHKGEVVLTWEPVTADITGGEFDASSVTYKVMRVYNRSSELLASGLTECTYTDEFCHPDTEQAAAYYTVIATTRGGDGDPTNTPFVCLGKDYPLPFTESFADGNLTHTVWITGNESLNSVWNINEDSDITYFTSQDKDNGYLYFNTIAGTDKGSFYSGRISLEGVPDAELRFYAVTPNPYAASTITIRIDSGEGFEDVETISLFADQGANMTWKLFKVNLGRYAGKSIRIAFAVETITPFVAIDNITVRGLWPDDLAITAFSAPAAVDAGKPFEITAKVINNGSQPQQDYKVTLYRNNQAVATLPGTQLEPDATAEFTFTETAEAVWGNVEYHVTVDLPDDAVVSDNTSAKASVTVRGNSLPIPEALSTSMADNGAVISWMAPDLESGKADIPVTGGMDDVTPFSIGLAHSQLGADDNTGGWLMIDGDGLPTISDTNLSYPNRCKPAAFMAFDNNEIDWEMFTDNDGDGLSFIAWASVGGRNDDWIISPRINGNAQTISFYAKSLMDSPESFEVLLSSTGRTTADFTITGERRVASTGQWGRVDIEIPEGTLFFAVRYVSYDNFALMLDNFSFTAAGPTVGLDLKGYNLYCNGLKLNTEPITVETFIHTAAEAGHSYQVTALYSDGESMPSAAVVLQPSGLGQINGDHDLPATYYNLQGVRVDNPTPGIYIRRQGDKATKVLIR